MGLASNFSSMVKTIINVPNNNMHMVKLLNSIEPPTVKNDNDWYEQERKPKVKEENIHVVPPPVNILKQKISQTENKVNKHVATYNKTSVQT